MNLKLNIVSFDVPYPPNYGGVIDVFYKIKGLKELGVEVILHTFEYGRGKHVELEEICSKVFYYERKLSLVKQFSRRPFIVSSRLNYRLLNNLSKNDYPIMFEGLHSTGFISDAKLLDRIKIVRTHNIEHDYYLGLARQESNYIKKIYFYIEALKLKLYESVLDKSDLILSLGFDDYVHFSTKYNTPVEYIPVFSSNQFNNNTIMPNTEKFILIHGDLSVMDNINSIKNLIVNVLKDSPFKVKIAGKNPPSELLRYSSDNIDIIGNPTLQEMDDLIVSSQVILLHSNQSTGVKLKLIESLSKGNFILCNSNIVANTSLQQFCEVEDDIFLYKSILDKLMNQKNDKKGLKERIEFIELNYGNSFSAKKIIDSISQVLQQK